MASPFEFSYVFTVIGKIWEAMPVTLLLTFAPLFIGFLFGVPFAVIRRFNVPFAASFLKNASNILKGIPAVLLVLMINYLILKPIDYLALSYEWAKPLQTMNKIYIGIAALSIYAVVQITETVLGALLSVGKGQYEAAYSIGLTRTKTLFRVVFPQAAPKISFTEIRYTMDVDFKRPITLLQRTGSAAGTAWGKIRSRGFQMKGLLF